MTINGVHTVNPRQTIHIQLLIAASLHGDRTGISKLVEELYGYYVDPV